MKKWLTARCWLFVCVLAACTGNGIEAGEKMDTLHCDLEIDQAIPAGKPVMLRLTLSNTSGQSAEVLQYFTPFEGILGDIFNIHYGDESLSYRGPLVKRGPPMDEDWLLLESGGVLTAEVDLSNAWDLARPGKYTLRLRNDMTYRLPGNTETSLIAVGSCQVVSFEVL